MKSQFTEAPRRRFTRICDRYRRRGVPFQRSSYLEEIRDRAQKLQSLSVLLNNLPLMPVGDQRTKAVNESVELFKWLVDQLEEAW